MRISDLSSDLCSSDLGLHAVQAFLRTVPPDVAAVLRRPIMDVLEARSGVLLWLGGVVGLWTTTSFIETIRDILRRAYGTHYTRPFWEYRLFSIAITIRSEESPVGKEGVSQCRSRWA